MNKYSYKGIQILKKDKKRQKKIKDVIVKEER